MTKSAVTVNFDSECCIPPDLPHHGEVACQVVRSHCQIIDCWKDWATFEVRLLLKQTIHSGGGPQWFTREVTIRESVMIDPHLAVRACRVAAAICRCVLNRGRLLCNGTAKIEFLLSPKHGCEDPCHPWHCGNGEEWLHMGCWRDDWDCRKKRRDCDWDDDWKHDCDDDWKRHDCDDDWKRHDRDHDRKRRFCDDDRKHDDCFDRHFKDDCHDDRKHDCDCDRRKKRCRCHDDDKHDRCDKRHHDRKHCRCDDHKRDDDHDFCPCCGRPKRRHKKDDDHDFDRCKFKKRSFQSVIVHGCDGGSKRFIFG